MAEKPLTYYDDLVRDALASGSFESIPGTPFVRLQAQPFQDANTNSSTSNARTIRVGSITTLLAFSKDHDQVFDITMGIAAYLAMRDFNQRKSIFLDDDSLELLEGCDLYLTMRFRDTAFHPSVAVQEFFQDFMVLTNDTSTTDTSSGNRTLLSLEDQLQSFATLGPLLSDSSTAVANLASVAANGQGVINMSPGSSSDLLENPFLYPYFARTIPDSSGKVGVLVAYMHDVLNVKHFGLLHVANHYGRAFLRQILAAANEYGMQVYVHSYRDNDPESLQKAIEGLQRIPVTYHFGIPTGGRFAEPILQLYDNHVIGPRAHQLQGEGDYARVWFFTGNVRDASEVDVHPRLHDLQTALHGSVTIADAEGQSKIEYLKSLMEQFRQEPQEMEYFLSRHVADSIFAHGANRDLWQEQLEHQKFPKVTNVRARSYDGVMALGLAACQAEDNDNQLQTFALHQRLAKLTFQGASGPVAFLDTASRDPGNLNHRLVNLIMKQDSETNKTILEEVDTIILNRHDGVINIERPITFADGIGDKPPPPLAPVTEDLNLVPNGLRIFCWIIAGAVVLSSLLFAAWAIYRRDRDRIRASQPAFLILLCVGTFLIGSSIVPWTFQEPMAQDLLSFGCMLHIWLLSIGFSTTFAALFARTRRISMIFEYSSSMRRVPVHAKDVMWAPISLLLINILLLTLWTALDPLQWVRVPVSKDLFGRVTESHGTCFDFGNSPVALTMLLLLVGVNALVIFATVVQSYRSRHLPSRFNERNHLAIATYVMLEAMLIGIPLLLVTGGHSNAEMMVGSWIFALSAFGVLLPMFVPKILIEEGFVEADKVDDQEEMRQSLERSAALRTSKTACSSLRASGSEFLSKMRSSGNHASSSRHFAVGGNHGSSRHFGVGLERDNV